MIKKGFTLIEIIVTVFILSLLMAILMPALHAVRRQAKTIKCASNVRELLLALTAYGTENNSLPYGFYDEWDIRPPKGGFSGNRQFDRTGWWWFDFLDVFSDSNQKNGNILNCPSKCLRNPTFKDHVNYGNYGINQSICKAVSGRGFHQDFEGIPLTINAVKSPQRTLLIVDAGYTLINWWHATQHPPGQLRPYFIEDASYLPGLKINAQKQLWQGQHHDAVKGRHYQKSVNVGYVDGHVVAKKADDLSVEKNDTQYKNRYPLWMPK
jgi:prepilin-type N-terminal cleavage/methylation domain-containing protein/prepilin-type processing-associated H-X9-DG protein